MAGWLGWLGWLAGLAGLAGWLVGLAGWLVGLAGWLGWHRMVIGFDSCQVQKSDYLHIIIMSGFQVVVSHPSRLRKNRAAFHN